MMRYDIGILVGLVLLSMFLFWGLGIIIMLRNPPLLSKARRELRGGSIGDRVAGWWTIPWMVALIWLVFVIGDPDGVNDTSRESQLAERRSDRVDDWGDVLGDPEWNELR